MGKPRTPPGPFIRKFRTSASCYVYDVNTNHIVKVDPVVYAVVGDVQTHPPTEIVERWSPTFGAANVRRALREIGRATREDGLFKPDRPRTIEPFGGRSILEQAQEPLCQHLILNVTEDCNLRCGHCVYGGKYPNQRVHSPKKMSWDVARRALDAFLQNSRKVREPHIGFYGGEPLLNFDLIRTCVEYVRARASRKYHFGLTTNGTLLRPAVREYLAANAFNLMVSLDGPRDVHDRFRVDRKGRGSWSRVIGNLESLHAASPRYFRDHVSLSAVVMSDEYLGQIRTFFESSTLLRHLNVTTSYPVYTPNRLIEDTTPAAEVERPCGHCALFRDCAAQLRSPAGLTGFLKGFFQRELYDIHYRQTGDGFNGGIHINGCCFPGQRRLFVSCQGEYFICERLDNGYPLGDVDQGLVPERVAALVEEYRNASRSCLQCWAVRFCTKCYASFSTGGRLDADLRRRECAAFRRDFEKVLVLYHEIAESSPRALGFLRRVTQS